MSFRDALQKHLLAIEKRDFAGFAETIDDEVLVVTAEGRLIRDRGEFLRMHRDWFAATNWTLAPTPVEIYEGAELGVACLHLEYREPPATRSLSYLTLVFRRRGARWLMFQDQNTPIR